MNKMDEISFKDKQEIFSRLEKVASQANLSDEDRARYEAEWKIYNDYFNTIESAKKRANEEGREEGRAEGREEGREEGRAEGRAEGELKAKIESARKMKAMNFPTETICQITGLSLEEIKDIQ